MHRPDIKAKNLLKRDAWPAGSMLEGGGQILRMATALSAITGNAVEISKIRAKRNKPGLRPQHLAGIELVADICGSYLDGAQVKSSNIVFQPGPVRPGKYTADPGTAGSCCLLAQVFPGLHTKPSSDQ